MRAERQVQPDGGPGRRRARLLAWVVVVVSVLAGAALALRGRRPALPEYAPAARPPSGAARPASVSRSDGTAGPAPGSGSAPQVQAQVADPLPPVDPEPVAEPVNPEPVADQVAEPVAEPVADQVVVPAPAPADVPGGGSDRGAGLDELVRVSGLGRRSAEALVVAGIGSLADLADSDVPTVAAALDTAGVARAATIASWPRQARRLLQG